MPISFACPQCGKQTTVADQYAGQSGPCGGCGKPITIPFAAGGAPFGPPGGGFSPAKSSGGGAGTVIAILAVIAVMVLMCGGVLVALLLPAVGAARGAAQRSMSMNNLRMIAIAMHNYNDANNQLPPAVVFSPEGQPLYSGYVLLLPYLEQAALFQQFDKSKAWNDPVNAQLSATIIQLFQDPASKNTAPGHADYLLVGGNNSLLSATKGRSTRFADCTDGTSNTIVVIESASGATSWAEPKTWDASQPISGNHRNVVLTALADGSVKAIPNTTPPDTLRRLAECNDGQPVNLPP